MLDPIPNPTPMRRAKSTSFVIHILRDNLPLCRFTRDDPREWPQGHLYVSDKNFEVANCADCQKLKLRRRM